MSDNTSVAVVGLDYELVTDAILQAASYQTAVAQRGAVIDIKHEYEFPSVHDDTVRMLLTGKARSFNHLRYLGTLFGVHRFLAT